MDMYIYSCTVYKIERALFFHMRVLVGIIISWLTTTADGCTNFIMDDAYGLSVRTLDLGIGPKFGLRTQPKGHALHGLQPLPPATFGHIISFGTNVSSVPNPDPDIAAAGLNEAGLSCDVHTLLNSSYPPADPHQPSKNLNLLYFCNWALGQHASVRSVKAALTASEVHLWGDASTEANGFHFIVRDATGTGLVVEFMDRATKLYDDLNDGVKGVGVFTNEPPFPWQLANVAHYRWKQSLARPATAMPGAWYPDERFLRTYLVKSSMPTPRSYQEAIQHALHALNTVTVPMGQQMGTDSGFGEGNGDHTHYGVIYDHKQRILYWRHQSNLQLERVRLADVLGSSSPLTLPMVNDLPFFQDAASKFERRDEL